LITSLLPEPVVAEEATVDPPDVRLFPAEEAMVARAVPKRRHEFGTGRHLARLAMARLGVEPAPLLTGERGSPVWPDGIVGTITHCAGYRAAAVARTSAIRSVGIDAEPDEPLPDGVLDMIALPEERERIAKLPAGVSWDRLLFSIKESVYKTWFPITRRWLDFEGASVTIDPEGTFSARILVDGPVSHFDGRWLAGGGLVLSAIALQPTDS
jgi:4'-phosphopantetheinyl transferase EntD